MKIFLTYLGIGQQAGARHRYKITRLENVFRVPIDDLGTPARIGDVIDEAHVYYLMTKKSAELVVE